MRRAAWPYSALAWIYGIVIPLKFAAVGQVCPISAKQHALAGAETAIPGVDIFQITKNGLALQATLQGTKYWKDKDLN